MVLWNQASRPISNGFRDIQRRFNGEYDAMVDMTLNVIGA